jgi:hypothetical protein
VARAQISQAPPLAAIPDPSANDPARTARELAKTHLFAQCLVRDFRPQVVRILEQTPESDVERSSMEQLRQIGMPCAEAVATLDRDTQYLRDYSISPLALRGLLSEALYEADFAAGARVRPRALARVPAVNAAAPAPDAGTGVANVSLVRRFASCVVTSDPDGATALLQMEPGSPAEGAAMRRFVAEFEYCFPSDDTADVNIPTARGFFAEAVYRRSTALARGEAPDTVSGQQMARRGARERGAAVIVPLAAQGNVPSGASRDYTIEDVRTLVEFSRCVARRRGPEAEALLATYRQPSFDRAAQLMSSRTFACTPDRSLRLFREVFAGGMAEEFVSTALGGGDFASGMRAGPGGRSLEPRDGTEAIGLCLVRNQPHAAAALLATAPASPEEQRLAVEMTSSVADCVAGGQIARITQPSLRAIVALAAYRLLKQNAAAPQPARN